MTSNFFDDPANQKEVDDRGGVYDPQTFKFDPLTGEPLDGENPPVKSGDPNLRTPRANEKHAAPPVQEWGEGVVTGDPADHYVHLANGAVIPGNSGGTHYHDPDLGLVPIVSVFPAGRSLK